MNVGDQFTKEEVSFFTYSIDHMLFILSHTNIALYFKRVTTLSEND